MSSTETGLIGCGSGHFVYIAIAGQASAAKLCVRIYSAVPPERWASLINTSPFAVIFTMMRSLVSVSVFHPPSRPHFLHMRAQLFSAFYRLGCQTINLKGRDLACGGEQHSRTEVFSCNFSGSGKSQPCRNRHCISQRATVSEQCNEVGGVNST